MSLIVHLRRRAAQQVAGGPCAGQGLRPCGATRGLCRRDQLHRMQNVCVVRCVSSLFPSISSVMYKSLFLSLPFPPSSTYRSCF